MTGVKDNGTLDRSCQRLVARKRGPVTRAIALRKRAQLLTVAREKAALDLQNLQKAFHQFAPQRVVEEVIKRGASTSGETREVTVLFADIVEFTAMSETLGPETLVRILNGYFEATCTGRDASRGSYRQFSRGSHHGNLWRSRK